MFHFDFPELNNKYSSKINISWSKLVVLGILAGAFIALGAASASAAAHGILDMGVSKTIAGVVFPVGLILIIFLGGELFTGDCLMILGVLDRRYSIRKMFSTLLLVWISNMLGAVLIAVMVRFSGQFGYNEGLLGAYSIKVAASKLHLSFSQAVISGILCNILVCAAVIMPSQVKSVTGKLGLVFIPIFAFVIGGYEHCIANMYYIPAGMLASMNPEYVQLAIDHFHVTKESLQSFHIANVLVHNLLPVTIGNMIGGMIFVGLPLFILNNKNDEQ